MDHDMIRQLTIWQQEVDALCALGAPCGKLKFVHTPTQLLSTTYDQDELEIWSPASTFMPNQGPLALISTSNSHNSSKYANKSFLFVENSLCHIMSDLKMMYGSGFGQEVEQITRDKLESSISFELVRIYQVKQDQWNQQVLDAFPAQGKSYFELNAPDDPIIRTSTLSVLIQQMLFNSTRRAAMIQIQSIKDCLTAAGVSNSVIDGIPNDPRTIQKWYNVDPILTTYLSCPLCFNLHDLDPDIKRCSQCDAELWRSTKIGGKSIDTPIRKYEHQKLEHWLARLLSRKDVEDVIDNYRPDYSEKPWGHEYWVSNDIMDSVVVHELKDEDGSPFFDAARTEGRYIFSLTADGFNPFHMKEAKQVASSTGIWMVLLNFPPHLRYLPENIYLVGVIPGPKVPLIVRGQITPTLKLVVDDLCKFRGGVKFSKTYKYPTGRSCKTALVIVIGDTIALRELAGFASATSQFPCTICWIQHQDLLSVDRESWRRRNLTDHLIRAYKWKNTENELVAQQRAFGEVHVRWSELNRLEYLNIILQTPADSLHTWKLNALPGHCRAIWGINFKNPGGDGYRYNVEEPESEPESNQRFKSRRKDNLMEDLIPYIVTTCQATFPDVSIHAQQYLYDWHHTPESAPLPNASVGPPPRPTQAEADAARTLWAEARANTREGNTREANTRRNIRSPLDDFQPNITDKRQYLTFLKNAYQYIHSAGAVTKQKVEDSGNTLTLRLLLKHCGIADYETRGGQTPKKAEYVDLLLTWVGDYIPEIPAEYIRPSVRDNAVLGSDVMYEIYGDMKKTLLPSWISPAPNDWGTPRRGKLSADEWGVIGLVHLPATLIRLWGVNSSGRKQEMLENFMHLINAIRLGSMRSLQLSHIHEYNRHVKEYILSLQRLYGSNDVSVIKPHHHAMMHMGESMYLFGPNHSRNTSFSERYIYFMQRQNINNKFGQLESSFMRSCSRSGNLSALLNEDPHSRQVMARTLEALDKLHKEDSRGTRTANLIDPGNTGASAQAHYFRLSDNDLQSVASCLDNMYGGSYYSNLWDKLERKAGQITDASLKGIRFSAYSKHSGNSHALCRWGDSARPIQIQDIFTHKHLQSAGTEKEIIFCKVRHFLPLDNDQTVRYHSLDQAYRKYGYGGLVGNLDANSHGSKIVKSEDIISHWAKVTLEDGVHAVIPLSQVV